MRNKTEKRSCPKFTYRSTPILLAEKISQYYFSFQLQRFKKLIHEENSSDNDEEDEDINHINSDEKHNDLILPHICQCSNCTDKNTLRLCYRMLDLNTSATKEQVKARYLSLIDSKDGVSEQRPELAYVDEGSDSECNLNKLIKNLTKNKMFTINESDRIEIITKAYNVITLSDTETGPTGTNSKEENGEENDSNTNSDDVSSAKMGDYVS